MSGYGDLRMKMGEGKRKKLGIFSSMFLLLPTKDWQFCVLCSDLHIVVSVVGVVGENIHNKK